MMTSLGLKRSENTDHAEDFSCGKKKMSFEIIKEKKMMDHLKSEKLGDNILMKELKIIIIKNVFFYSLL